MLKSLHPFLVAFLERIFWTPYKDRQPVYLRAPLQHLFIGRESLSQQNEAFVCLDQCDQYSYQCLLFGCPLARINSRIILHYTKSVVSCLGCWYWPGIPLRGRIIHLMVMVAIIGSYSSTYLQAIASLFLYLSAFC